MNVQYSFSFKVLTAPVFLLAWLALVGCFNQSNLSGQEISIPKTESRSTESLKSSRPNPDRVSKLARLLAGENRGALIYVRFADGTEWNSMAGSRSAEGAPVTGDEHFEIGSVTKLFTAIAILQLTETGLLDLDASLTNFFDRELLNVLVGRDRGKFNELKVRHLLSHTTGMGDYINIGSDAEVVALYGADGSQKYKPADLIEITRSYTEDPSVLPESHPPLPYKTLKELGIENYDAMPGAYYSNTGYIMLGMIIEKVSGTSYEDYLIEHIFEPLGLQDTGFGTRDAKSDFTGYSTGVVDGPIAMSPSFAWSAGEIVSSKRDLATFFSAAFAGKLFQNKTTLKFWKSEGFRPLMGIPKAFPDYGYGLMRKSIGEYELYGHDGQSFGATALVAHCPKVGVTIVLARNDSQHGQMWNIATSVLVEIKKSVEADASKN